MTIKEKRKTEQNKKYFLLDSSVILDDVENIKRLSEDNYNYLFINDTVLEEINKIKDNGQDEVAFQARTFGKLADNDLGYNITYKNLPKKVQATIFNNNIKDNYYMLKLSFNTHSYTNLIVIHREHYREQNKNINDYKIGEIAQDYNIELLTNDILFKVISRVNGINVSGISNKAISNISDISFEHTINDSKLEEKLKTLTNFEQIIVQNHETDKINEQEFDSNKEFGIVINNKLEKYNFDDVDMYKNTPVKPKTLEQDFYYNTILHKNTKILACSGSTGSGKTLMAVQAAIELIRRKEVNGIIYTRNTVTSNDRQSELGFRKGDESKKLNYFMYPLYSAINFILSKQNPNIENLGGDTHNKTDTDTIEFMEKYNIEIMDIAHLRGTTITNKIVIIDESQNMNNSTLKLVGTRMGERCKLLILGDINQVDHPYLTKQRNALSTILNLAKKHNEVAGFKLKKTIRSETAEFFDLNI